MSEYSQTSFLGGMNLLSDDTRLQSNQYRLGFNLRNRYDTLDEVRASKLDTSLPAGIIQEIVTFGEYIVAFVSGRCYYRHYTDEGWQTIPRFAMSISAPRYWTCQVPLATTNYVRATSPTNVTDYTPAGNITCSSGSTTVSGAGTFFTRDVISGSVLTLVDGTFIGIVADVTNDSSMTLVSNATHNETSVPFRVLNTQVDNRSATHLLSVLSGSTGGNLPGLLVQDNLTQPQFLYIDSNGLIQVRTTQTYSQWSFDYDINSGIMTSDNREYVPIGNTMAYVDGVLYIAATDGAQIYRSVSGRPLDFVINIQPNGDKGGDASTTSYAVGADRISCLRGTADGTLFVAAGNSNYAVSKNYANNAPLIFGEYNLIRKFLFESTCLNDRCVVDSLGDTRFIDLTGVRSFNAIMQVQNEGRNAPFTASIAAAFAGITQDVAAAIVFDNYEFYAMNSVFGPVIAVYDTISNCWSSFDIEQTGGKKVKQFAKIELGVQRLYAITEDDKMYTLYSSDEFAVATFLTGSMTTSAVQGDDTVKMSSPKNEIKLQSFRCILNKITQDSTLSVTPIIDNRVSNAVKTITKEITYVPPTTSLASSIVLADINTQLTNIFIPTPNCEQGWKTSLLVSWTGGGTITQYYAALRDESPNNPMKTQATTK